MSDLFSRLAARGLQPTAPAIRPRLPGLFENPATGAQLAPEEAHEEAGRTEAVRAATPNIVSAPAEMRAASRPAPAPVQAPASEAAERSIATPALQAVPRGNPQPGRADASATDANGASPAPASVAHVHGAAWGPQPHTSADTHPQIPTPAASHASPPPANAETSRAAAHAGPASTAILPPRTPATLPATVLAQLTAMVEALRLRPNAETKGPAGAPTRAAEPIIEVTIGRIEVRNGAAQPARSTPARAPAALPLEDYLRSRRETGFESRQP